MDTAQGKSVTIFSFPDFLVSRSRRGAYPCRTISSDRFKHFPVQVDFFAVTDFCDFEAGHSEKHFFFFFEIAFVLLFKIT